MIVFDSWMFVIIILYQIIRVSGDVYEPSHEKTNNLGFLPGLTNICLYSPRFKKLENFI